MSEKATLTLRGKSYEFPVIEGSEHEVAIDISTLRSASGAITIDEAFGNTGACKSAVTFIDGDEGILRYRGYPIEQLAEKSNFLEVAYLLVNGHLPEKTELESFQRSIVKHTLLHEDMKTFFEAFPPNAHPMAILSSVVCGLSTFYPGASNLRSKTEQDQAIMRLIAKLPTIAAMSYRKSRGLPVMYPDNSLSYAGNFLRMMFGFPTEPYPVDPDIERTLDVLFILHADHEQNCSTSTVRVVGSAQANLFASIAAGICALWGPLHGGANQAVLEMLERIHQDGGDVQKAVAAAKDKNSGFKLMGFGHRVYKNHDPRARIIKRHADGARAPRHQRSAARHRPPARRGRAQRRVLRRAQALPERGLLLGHHLSRPRLPDGHVHRAVRPRAPARLDRPVEGDERAGLAHHPPPSGLHGRDRPRLPGLRTLAYRSSKCPISCRHFAARIARRFFAEYRPRG
jgi:citrate synthase